jgi:rod shape-determining protein MreD
MKILRSVILGIIVLYFQILIAPKFSLFGIIPNFFIAYIIYTTIKIGMKPTLTIAFLLGLAFDLMTPHLLGLNALSLILISFIVGNFHENVNKRRFAVVAISIIFINIIFYLIQISYFLFTRQVESGLFRLMLFTIIFNSFFTIITNYVLIIISKLKLVIDV